MHKTFIIGSIFNVPLQTKTAFTSPLSNQTVSTLYGTPLRSTPTVPILCFTTLIRLGNQTVPILRSFGVSASFLDIFYNAFVCSALTFGVLF